MNRTLYKQLYPPSAPTSEATGSAVGGEACHARVSDPGEPRDMGSLGCLLAAMETAEGVQPAAKPVTHLPPQAVGEVAASMRRAGQEPEAMQQEDAEAAAELPLPLPFPVFAPLAQSGV